MFNNTASITKPAPLYNEEKDCLWECIDIKEPRPIQPTKNAWLRPENQFGRMEQGVVWEDGYTSPIKGEKPGFINKDDIPDRKVDFDEPKKPAPLYNEEKDCLWECIDIKEPRPIQPTKNAWLHPEDEFGRMEQGVVWEDGYTSPIKGEKPEFINKDDIPNRKVD